jgi:hypothetical protein
VMVKNSLKKQETFHMHYQAKYYFRLLSTILSKGCMLVSTSLTTFQTVGVDDFTIQRIIKTLGALSQTAWENRVQNAYLYIIKLKLQLVKPAIESFVIQNRIRAVEFLRPFW